MELQRVTSSNIEAIGYDVAASELHVLFRNGSLYVFPKVDAESFAAFRDALSVGQHFNRVIRPTFGMGRKLIDASPAA